MQERNLRKIHTEILANCGGYGTGHSLKSKLPVLTRRAKIYTCNNRNKIRVSGKDAAMVI
jgi:hypothetical protein